MTDSAQHQAETDQRTINDAVVQVSRMISGTYPPLLDAEAHLWRRVMKVAEETGEVTEALLGLLGENPRKGITHTGADLRKELFDVALAALGAAAYLDGHMTDVEKLFRHHAIGVRDRLADVLNPHPDRIDSPSCRALDGVVLPPVTRVHNHAPYRPNCNERAVGGQLRGACLNDDGSDR